MGRICSSCHISATRPLRAALKSRRSDSASALTPNAVDLMVKRRDFSMIFQRSWRWKRCMISEIVEWASVISTINTF